MDSYRDDINFPLLDITCWMPLVVNYSWSFGSNKFECQAAEYFFSSEILLGEITSLLTISPLWTIFLFPFFNVSRKIPSADAQITSLQKPIGFNKPITQQGIWHFLDQNNWETTSWKTKYLVTHCFKELSNLLFHISSAFLKSVP